jgi:hypothetical protein
MRGVAVTFNHGRIRALTRTDVLAALAGEGESIGTTSNRTVNNGASNSRAGCTLLLLSRMLSLVLVGIVCTLCAAVAVSGVGDRMMMYFF